MRHSLAIAGWLLLSASAAQGQAPCGYINAGTRPPSTKDLYPVAIREIDGVKVEGGSSGPIKLDVGLHRITVQERIADERRGRAKLGQLITGNSAVSQKVLEVNIQADGSYLIAVQLLEKSGATKASADYWEPVVWRTLLVSCR